MLKKTMFGLALGNFPIKFVLIVVRIFMNIKCLSGD